MSKFTGRLADIGFKIETTRGTAEASASYWIPKMSLSIDDKVEVVVDESSVGVIEDAVDTKVVKKFAEGELEGKVGDKSIGTILKAVMGTVSTTGPSQTTVYTHTFTVEQSAQHDSITIFQDDPNQDYTYALGMITSLSLDATIGEFAKMTVGFRSKVGSTATLSPSYTTENNFLPQHGQVKIASTQSGLDGASAISVRSASINFSKNVEDDQNLGSVDPTDILNKQFAVEGTIELVFNDNTFKTQMLADTAQALRLRLTNSDVTIGSSLNPQITFDFYKVKFQEFTRNYENNEITTATVNFKGLYSTTDSKMLDITLVNEVASY